MSEVFDLIVVGGGPAGASAAITAARDGWKVLLLERDRFPRHKVCGEFVSAESLELLRWLLGTANDQLLQSSVMLAESRLLLDDRCVRIPVSPPAASITRYDLDLALWNVAQDEGVATLPKTALQQIKSEAPFRIATSAGEFSGRALINASGRWSNLTQARNGTNRTRWLGMKAHFHGEMEPGVELHFFDGGYCGVQPVRGPGGEALLNVCALVRPGMAETFDDLFVRHPVLERQTRSWKTAYPTLTTFPAIFREPQPTCGMVLNAGDAAVFVDPFVGDGISIALRGGHMAARCLSRFLRGERTLTEAGGDYEHVYRRTLRPVYGVSSIFRRFLGMPRSLRSPVLAACELSPRLAQFLVRATRSRSDSRAELATPPQ